MQILSRRTQRVSERYDESEDDERMESVCRESPSLFSSSVLYCFNVSSILFIALNSSDVTSSFYGPILILFFYFYLRFLFCFMALIHFNYPYSFFVSVCSYNLCLSLYERLFLVIRTQIMSLFSVLFAETLLFIKSSGPCREVTAFSCWILLVILIRNRTINTTDGEKNLKEAWHLISGSILSGATLHNTSFIFTAHSSGYISGV